MNLVFELKIDDESFFIRSAESISGSKNVGEMIMSQ